MVRLIDLTGMTFGRLTVIGRAGTWRGPSGRTEALWDVLCDCGRRTRAAGGHLRGGTTRSCGQHARVAVPSYSTNSKRRRRQLGPASAKACAECGQPAGAWAYDHDDPNERVDRWAYSADLQHYRPLCWTCSVVERRRRAEGKPKHTRPATARTLSRARALADEIASADPCGHVHQPTGMTCQRIRGHSTGTHRADDSKNTHYWTGSPS